MDHLVSIADLQHHFGLPGHVINYAVRLHGPEPAGRVGITRVWRRDDLPQIAAALRKTAARSTSPVRQCDNCSAPEFLDVTAGVVAVGASRSTTSCGTDEVTFADRFDFRIDTAVEPRDVLAALPSNVAKSFPT